MDDCQDNIRSLNVFGGNFTDVKGDYYHIRGNFLNRELESGRGIDKLSQVVSLGAIHDSSERYPPPRCHPETRTRVRTLIICWIEDPNPTCFVLWLYGPAGAGKSAILQSIAEECCSLDGRFGGSFFFSRGKAGRDQGHFLFSTIAYQLALNLPYLRKPIDDIMQANPTLYTKSVMVQMRSLIIDSFRKLTENIEHTPTVIIDGLDECDGHETQQLILEIIYEAVAVHKLPLRFLIASRPEAYIREAFDKPTLRNITKRVVLDESFGPNQDIEKYLRDGFESIYKKNSRLMEQEVHPWPGTGIIDLLVQKASGQFIYASTVLKFVGAEFYNPISQLEIILEPFPSNGTPFSDLDHLYSQIISTSPFPEKLICVLGTILALYDPQPPEVIEDLLGMKPGEVGLVLRGLHSLIKFPYADETFKNNSVFLREAGAIVLLHASFRDYLVDAHRSAHFFINLNIFCAQITKAGFQLMTKWISNPWGLNTGCFPCRHTWVYLQGYLPSHYRKSSAELRGDIVGLLLAHAEIFWTNHPNFRTVDIFEPLHCAMTALARMAFGKREKVIQDFPEIAFDATIKQIEKDPDSKFNENLVNVFYKYRDILDASYHLLLAESRDLEKLIQFAPGFLVMRHFEIIPDVVKLLDIDETSFLDLLERNRQLVDFLPDEDPTFPRVRLNHHVRDFLTDRNRSNGRYHNPRHYHLAICLNYYRFIFDHPRLGEKLFKFNMRNIRLFLYYNGEHLSAIDVEPSEEIPVDDPIWSFLDHLHQIVYYHPAFDSDLDPVQIGDVWKLVSETLCWVQRNQELLRLSTVHRVLKCKLCFLADRIYSQILCVDGSNGQALVTVRAPIVAIMNHRTSSDFKRFLSKGSISKMYYFDDPRNVKATGISHGLFRLFLLNGLIPSLTEYLTSRTRAKKFYIDADTYHAQMAEFCLKPILGTDRDRAGKYWKFHLVRARPSQEIFARLRLLSSQSFIGPFGPPIDSFRSIITWLEGLPTPPLDIYLQYQKFLLTAEEEEAENATEVSVEGLRATEESEGSQLPPILPNHTRPSIKDMLEYLQDYVATFVGWLLDV